VFVASQAFEENGFNNQNKKSKNPKTLNTIQILINLIQAIKQSNYL